MLDLETSEATYLDLPILGVVEVFDARTDKKCTGMTELLTLQPLTLIALYKNGKRVVRYEGGRAFHKECSGVGRQDAK